MFEGMGKEQEQKEVGPPSRKTFSDLPWGDVRPELELMLLWLSFYLKIHFQIHAKLTSFVKKCILYFVLIK